MNVDLKDELDGVIDETLASMVAGEPRRVSAASIRQAMGGSRGSRLPVFFAVAAALVMALGVVVKLREASVAPSPVSIATHTEAPAPTEERPAPSESPMPASTPAASMPARRVLVSTTNEAPYEGLPRLAIALIDLPEPLATERIELGEIRIPLIEIAPLSISTLTNEPEHQ